MESAQSPSPDLAALFSSNPSPAAPAVAPEQGALAEAHQSVPGATEPVAVTQGVPEQHDGSPEQPGTPATSDSPQQQQQISYEQYQQLQNQLAERDKMLAEIQRMAAEQEARQKGQQAQAELKSRLSQEVKRAIESGNEEAAIESIFGFVNGVLNDVAGAYQQQFTQFEQDVREAFWAATMPGYADDLIRQYNLPPEIKNDLMQFRTEQEMTAYALRVKATVDQLRAQMQQQTIQQQVAQRQESGVQAVATPGSSTVGMNIQPGTTNELLPVLRNIFNV